MLQESGVKYGLSEGPPVPYCKYEPQSVLEKSNYKLYYDRFKITDRVIHNNRPDVVVLKVTIKQAYLADVGIPNANKPRSTITERLQKYTDLKEELIKTRKLNAVYIVPLVLSTTGTIPNKLHESLKLLNLRPSLFFLMQKV